MPPVSRGAAFPLVDTLARVLWSPKVMLPRDVWWTQGQCPKDTFLRTVRGHLPVHIGGNSGSHQGPMLQDPARRSLTLP